MAALAVLVAAGAVAVVLAGRGSGRLGAAAQTSSTQRQVTDRSTGQAGTTSTSVGSTSTTDHARAVAKLLSKVSVTPADRAHGVLASAVVTVKASIGRLAAVSVRSAQGATVAGALSPTGEVWKSTVGELVPSTHYTVSYELTGPGGLQAPGKAVFSTAAPAKSVTATVWPVPGLIVGVGEPITFTFSRPVLSYAAESSIVSHLHIAMSDPVPGGWHWFSAEELHFRPTSYWPVGEQVSVTGNLDGWRVAAGEWGSGPVTTEFAVGAKHVTVVNLTTHRMDVYDNGQLLYDWPISAGAPNWPTTEGTHIVLDREAVVRMDSATVGIPVNSPGGYNELVYWDVHIADAGEYVHAAPWDLSIQGQQNVSHGCINISPARAETFLHFSRVGDIVQVVGPGRAPRVTDHGLMDWSFPPSVVNWAPATVSRLSTPVSTTSPTTLPPPPAGAPFYPTTIPPNPTTSGTTPVSLTSTATTVATGPGVTTATTAPAGPGVTTATTVATGPGVTTATTAPAGRSPSTLGPTTTRSRGQVTGTVASSG